MEAIRTVIDSERLATIIDLPDSLRHREVEIIVLPQKEENETGDDRSALRSLKGCLHEYADPSKWEEEEGAWERAAAEKYLEKMKDDRS